MSDTSLYVSSKKKKNEPRNFLSFVGKLLLLRWTQSRPFTWSPDQRDNPAGGGNSINKSEHGCPGPANHTTIFNMKNFSASYINQGLRKCGRVLFLGPFIRPSMTWRSAPSFFYCFNLMGGVSVLQQSQSVIQV